MSMKTLTCLNLIKEQKIYILETTYINITCFVETFRYIFEHFVCK